MKKQRNWLLIIGLTTVSLIFYAVTMFPQDRIFSEYKKAFDEIQHPSGTKFIATFNSFGALYKTRVMYKDDFAQGCDYRVGEIRQYSGTKESIEAFYATQIIEIRGQKVSPGVLFIPLNAAGSIDLYEWTHDELAEIGPAGYDIIESLQGDEYFFDLKPHASYYYVDIGGFSLSDKDIRCQF